MIIHPYKKGSHSARQIKLGLVAEGIRTLITQRIPRPRTLIINWGGKEEFLDRHARVLNRPSTITSLRNKLTFFEKIGNDERTVPWTTDPKIAETWKSVFARMSLTGSSGQGIVVWQQKAGLALPHAPLYTKRMFTTHEYRIHVFKDRTGERHAIDTQRKVFRKTDEVPAPPNGWAVRSHRNGFTFIRGDRPPDELVAGVINFVSNYFPDLDFGAFDVLYNEDTRRFYVLEGNSAPGLEGQTVNTYVQSFKNMV
jgi:hypothetical protein